MATRSGVSTSVVGRHEGGIIGSLRAIERHAAVLGLRIDLRLVGRAGELVRLADEEHAAIAETIARLLRDWGLVVEPEASFSKWGERGRVDLLAYDPMIRTLVIVEVKTQLLDLQEAFGALNVKERLAGTLAEAREWSVRRRVCVLAVASTAANRDIVRSHPSLFARFSPRKLTAATLNGGADQLLHWVLPREVGRGSWTAGRRRVRRVKAA